MHIIYTELIMNNNFIKKGISFSQNKNFVNTPILEFIDIMLFFVCADKPENVTLNVNISSERVCAGVTVKFTCEADANPAVDTYRLSKDGEKIVNMDGSGVSIRTLNTDGQFDYRCEANNSAGTETSSVTTLIVDGKLA